MRGVTARLFDDDGLDRELDLTQEPVRKLTERQLLWVDVDRSESGALDALEALDGPLRLDDRDRSRIVHDRGRALVRAEKDRVHITVESLADDPDAGRLDRREIDLLVAPNLVISIHDGPAEAIERFVASFDGDTRLGALSAADLLSSLIDEVVVGYLDIIERIEREIDELDQRALRGRDGDGLLTALVGLRRRISLVRRTLAPHRGVIAALARPEHQADDGIGRPWPGLADRVESAMEAIESARDALLGTYDIHMGRTAQHANDVMRTLTLISAILLPAVVLAGIMGMNFPLPFFDDPGNFSAVLATMAVLAGVIVLVARWRRWL